MFLLLLLLKSFLLDLSCLQFQHPLLLSILLDLHFLLLSFSLLLFHELFSHLGLKTIRIEFLFAEHLIRPSFSRFFPEAQLNRKLAYFSLKLILPHFDELECLLLAFLLQICIFLNQLFVTFLLILIGISVTSISLEIWSIMPLTVLSNPYCRKRLSTRMPLLASCRYSSSSCAISRM